MHWAPVYGLCVVARILQASLGRSGKQHQKQTSLNHIQALHTGAQYSQIFWRLFICSLKEGAMNKWASQVLGIYDFLSLLSVPSSRNFPLLGRILGNPLTADGICTKVPLRSRKYGLYRHPCCCSLDLHNILSTLLSKPTYQFSNSIWAMPICNSVWYGNA